MTNTVPPVNRRLNLRTLLSASLIIGLVTISCSRFNAFDRRINEGLIEYEVTFPYLDDSNNMLASLLPEKMQMYFQKDRYTTELATVGGLFKNRFVASYDERTLVHQLKVFKKKLEASYNKTAVQHQINSLPQLTIIETNEIDTVAGFPCRKAIGIFDHISLPEMTIYYTDRINIESPNWFNQFSGIDGVLMQYEIEQLGIRMRFRAKSVQSLKVNPKDLLPEPDYKDVTPDQLQVEIQELLNSFNL